MSQIKEDTLVSGKTSFKIEVPYKLVETGKKGKEKPLIIYLHGFGETIERFEKKCDRLKEIDAYHLFIQGPYPIYDKKGKKNVSEWGRAWYLYDGNRGQFIKSLEVTSEFIQEIVDRLLKQITPSRVCVIGYSMGGYLAGYFALTRWKHVTELVVCAARIKTEILQEDFSSIKHLNILAVHGKEDDLVLPSLQKKEVELLKSKEISSEFKLIDGGHPFTKNYTEEIFNWLNKKSY